MHRQTVFMFSGPGFQYHRMGAGLYAHHPLFKFHMDRCDELARPFLGDSLLDILYRGKRKSVPFDRLLHANPAMLSIQYSLAQVLLDAGIRPHLLLGCGLGEITAAATAGLMELGDALRLAIDMARLIEEKTPPTETEAGPGHRKRPLQHGLHTRLVDPIAAEVKAMGAEIPLHRARIPIVSACRRWVMREPDADFFWKILRYPWEFESTIAGLLEMGDYAFIDIGPCGTLSGDLERLLPPDSPSIALQAMNRTGRDLLTLEMLKAEFFPDPVALPEAPSVQFITGAKIAAGTRAQGRMDLWPPKGRL